MTAAPKLIPISANVVVDMPDVSIIRLMRGKKCIGTVFKAEKTKPVGWRFQENIVGAHASTETFPTAAQAAARRWGDEAAEAVNDVQTQE